MLDDVAELAQALDVRNAPAGDHRQDPATSQLMVHGLPAATDGVPLTRLRVCVMSLTLAAVVMTCRGGASAVADQMVVAARLPPVDR
ncbi:hypothetical protein Z951_30595 [Streptomyces sp. PRh5]|nr:hypothetical protein Z951_30595 [Streptomyces sp. PRh5]